MPSTYVRRPGERVEQKGYRRIRVRVPQWVDPFPYIQGSRPEKMVLAELVRRGIYFEHTPQRNNVGGGVDPTWEPDFLFPQFKIWLEVQGGYFHTLPGAIEADSLRFAIISMAGWRPIWWWDWDIESRLQDIMNEVPEFYVAQPDTVEYGRGSWYEGGDGIDHLKGLRKALSNRARPPQRLKKRLRKKRRPK